MSWADGPLLCFDLETTGIDVETARIVTACVIDIAPGKPSATAEWLADPGIDIPAKASAIHGVTTEHAREHGRPVWQVAMELYAVIGDAWRCGVPVVGHNIGCYDLTVLGRAVNRHLEDLHAFDVTGPVIDTLTLDRAVRRSAGPGGRTLTKCCEHYGIELRDAHSAAADALAAGRLAWKIARRHPANVGAMGLPSMTLWQQQKHLSWANSFGGWLRTQGRADDVVREWPVKAAPGGIGKAHRHTPPRVRS